MGVQPDPEQDYNSIPGSEIYSLIAPLPYLSCWPSSSPSPVPDIDLSPTASLAKDEKGLLYNHFAMEAQHVVVGAAATSK